MDYDPNNNPLAGFRYSVHFFNQEKTNQKIDRLRIINSVSDGVRDKFDGPSRSRLLLRSNRYEFITRLTLSST